MPENIPTPKSAEEMRVEELRKTINETSKRTAEALATLQRIEAADKKPAEPAERATAAPVTPPTPEPAPTYEKKPGWFKRNWLGLGLSTLIASGGFVGVKTTLDKKEKKSTTPETATKEIVTTSTKALEEMHIEPRETNMTVAIETAQKRAETERKLAEKDAEIRAIKERIEKIEKAAKSTPVIQSKPRPAGQNERPEETTLQGIRKILEAGKPLKGNEDIIWNQAIIRYGVRGANERARQNDIPKPPKEDSND